MIFLLKGLDMIFKCVHKMHEIQFRIMQTCMEVIHNDRYNGNTSVTPNTLHTHSILYWLWMIWHHGVTIHLPTTTFVWNVTFFTLNIGYRIDENWNAERGFKCNFLESELSDWFVKNKHHIVLATLILTYILNDWYSF